MTVKSPRPVHQRAGSTETEVLSPTSTMEPEVDSFSPVPVPGLVGAQVYRTQESADVLGGAAVPAETRSILDRRRGSGASLPRALALRMEAGFGTPLDHVRVHADAEADVLSRQLQATAFTLGSDIYFSRGSYAPGSDAGQRLLAHEMAHVAQQSTGTGGDGGTMTIGHAADPAEAQADAMADTVLRSPWAERDGAELRRSAIRRWSTRG